VEGYFTNLQQARDVVLGYQGPGQRARASQERALCRCLPPAKRTQ
jgi:hypothetical protein